MTNQDEIWFSVWEKIRAFAVTWHNNEIEKANVETLGKRKTELYNEFQKALSLAEKPLYCEMCKNQTPKGFFKTIPICGDCYLRVIEDYEKQISDLKSEKNSNIENAKQRIYSKFNHFKPSTKFIIGKIIDEELKKELKK